MDKKHLRQKHKQIRNEKDRFELLERSLSITQQVIDMLIPYDSVGIYISVDTEVNTRAIIEYCFENNKRVCVPKIMNKEMIFVDLHSIDECIEINGLLEPQSTLKAEDPEIQIIPMLAFNQRYYRLGYGGGYYDKYLSTYDGFKLGICYSFGKDETLIESDFDISCQMIISDK